VARDGRHIDMLGHYNPRTEPSTVEIDTERAHEWLQKGAQPTDRVRKLLKIAGLEA
jgi:small subunit ribosomal protein S16